MKKLFIILAVSGLAFGATACKKERTCQCTFNNGSGVAVSKNLGKGKLNDQKQQCERLTTDAYTCSLDLL